MIPVELPFVNFAFELFFYVTLLLFLIYSVMVAYHWVTYGSNERVSSIALGIYFVGAVPIILLMFLNL